MAEKIIRVSDSDFSGKVIDSRRISVVDFWATWCAPCRRLDGVLEEMARDYDGRVAFYRVDVNESGGTASKYAVRSIPTLLFFDGGEVVDQAVGSISREDIKEKLEKLLGV
ncbi:MAG: thioredoxin [Candidatus Krumholzibacteria bacterium]|nr:thioredoxin [Candidatus Krumholzibacteria bacterium]